MSIAQTLMQFFINLDENLILIINQYGFLVYPLLFLVIFIETGIVLFPFLPGDSLIFAAGTIAAAGSLNIYLLLIILCVAAIIGDSVNYVLGKYFGNSIVKHVKKEYMQKTEKFYEEHGGKTIILARFIPIIRTFAPFVAGIGKMKYSKFFSYNVIGGIVWVSLFLFLGFFLGNLPIIKNNLTIVIIIIISLSVVPVIIEYIKHKIKKRKLNKNSKIETVITSH